ncbi:MAG: glycosyltransferase family 4 protein, partial [Roseiflexus sp.]
AAVRLLSHQTRDLIEHITELYEADQNLRAALYDDPPPPPPRIIPPKTNIDTLMAAEHHDE